MGRLHKGSWLSLRLIAILFFVPSSGAQTWISAVSSSTTPTTTTITWTTAVPADTQVKYSVTTSYNSRTSLNSSPGLFHTATLTGLTPATPYHFRVMSRDGSGILVTSLGYAFTTKAVPVSVSVSPRSATVASGKTQQFTATVANSFK
jgi:hypothetical protein